MLYQINNMISDIKNQWVKLLFILVHLLIAMSLLCYLIQIFIDHGLFEKQMDSLTGNNSIYMFNDKTEDFRFNQIVNEDETISKMTELYSFIDDDLDLKRYTADTSCSLAFESNYQMPSDSIKREEGNLNQIKTLRINKEFFSIFNLKGNYNYDKVEEAFTTYTEADTEIPIIMGSKFKKNHKKGDMIYDFRQQAYKIYGFFDNGSYYIAPNRIKSMEHLDNYIVMPSCITKDTDELTATIQFLSSNFITDDKSQMYKIIEKTEELDLFSLDLRSFKEQCKDIQAKTLEKILFIGALICILFAFALVGFIGNIIQFISDSTREFSVNLLCGATENQIVLRIAIQIVLIILLSNIAPFFIFGLSKAFIITFCYSMLIGLLILLYPIVKINVQSIIMMIRRNVE